MVYFISIMASLVLMIVNYLLVFVIRRFSLSERHETTTKLNVSVAIKLTIARFINSSVVLVIVNSDAKEWFKGGNLVYDASILIILLTFQQPFLYSINIWGRLRKCKRNTQVALGEECKLTQREANLICEGPPLDVANNIANFMNLIMTCIFYSPIIPQAIPFAFVGSILQYWANKYMLLRKHKMPDMFSVLMASFFANFMPWIIFVWTISYFIFLERIEAGYEFLSEIRRGGDIDIKQVVISAKMHYRPQIAMIFVAVCLITPIRSFINRMVDENEALDQDKAYQDLCHTFPSDYDKENPLTSKKGQMRLIEIQL
mmetsp:Transcript_17892/g.30406  ORF Transcript_17892/g.30406 Transcript_17892/m.30406 type:complete len:316 (+) Transcript_17892:1730-2677(+)